MSDLADLQRDFQRYVLRGDSTVAGSINGTRRVPATTRLAIYSQAYRLRLIDALANNFPRLQQLLGEREFALTAQGYIDEHPSRTASIRWYGSALPQQLARAHPERPWLSELARWEWAITTAFDARDATALLPQSLVGIEPQHWPALVFDFHPSVQHLRMRTNAPVLFKALSQEQPATAPVMLEREQSWLIWRQALKTQYRSMSEDEAAALDAMRGGATFAATCDLLRKWHPDDRVASEAAGTLKRWIVDELCVGKRIADSG
jgi:hypothetical protein